MAEECKVKERNVRRDANEQFKILKKDNEITEDELYNLQEEVQKLTDRYIEKADKSLSAKEKEIMEI
jgi:ribosome recycling factor